MDTGGTAGNNVDQHDIENEGVNRALVCIG
jgi:hypothetical protein